MDYIVVKIGSKGFKSYYLPIAGFLNQNKNIKVVALGKKVQMAAYLCSIIQKHGAMIEDVRISVVELPENEKKERLRKPIDVVMIEIYMIKNMFVPKVFSDS